MAVAAGTVLASLALGVAQRGVPGSDGGQSLRLSGRSGHRLVVSSSGLGNAAGSLVGTKPVLLALLVEPEGQIVAGNVCELRSFLFAEPLTSDYPGIFLRCFDDGECIAHCAAGGGGGLFTSIGGDNCHSEFIGSTKRKK